ncbi:MAG TPA: DCC1-like thiol-disulfide oxidoreductase family protein [Chthoniobacterales bacterium]|jgi:predicted DCC family thiol-disulfide oxidoreductase YuxK|nr:DCC1-like thiol-disulfide oxidoreductase family protein [Chthoniobacterales bacterium]
MNGWILFDAECRMCRDMVRRFEKTFTSRGFVFAPLQLELQPGERPSEMRVRTVDGRDSGGADAVLFLAGFVWWGRPLRWFAKIPGAKRLLRRIYREIACRRSCDNGACFLPEVRT